MKITTVLFDLDGTLLPMDQNTFAKTYFGGLAKHLAPLGYEPQKLIDTVWAGTAAMVKNDGSCTNEVAFWKLFSSVYGKEQAEREYPHFEVFYRDHFDQVAAVCGHTPSAKQIIKELKARGIRTVLATNPLFPSIATEKRMAWAGLAPSDFAYFTTYENSSFCKPNPAYYQEILAKIGCSAEECAMIGNDVGEDMIAEKLGMKVFLLTDCIINKKNEDISKYPHGSFAELRAWLAEILP
jgi:FMN phosphatase YigB (HAD superfamily)